MPAVSFRFCLLGYLLLFAYILFPLIKCSFLLSSHRHQQTSRICLCRERHMFPNHLPTNQTLVIVIIRTQSRFGERCQKFPLRALPQFHPCVLFLAHFTAAIESNELHCVEQSIREAV